MNEEIDMTELVDNAQDPDKDYLEGVNKEVEKQDPDPDAVIKADLEMDPGAATESFVRKAFGLSAEDIDDINARNSREMENVEDEKAFEEAVNDFDIIKSESDEEFGPGGEAAEASKEDWFDNVSKSMEKEYTNSTIMKESIKSGVGLGVSFIPLSIAFNVPFDVFPSLFFKITITTAAASVAAGTVVGTIRGASLINKFLGAINKDEQYKDIIKLNKIIDKLKEEKTKRDWKSVKENDIKQNMLGSRYLKIVKHKDVMLSIDTRHITAVKETKTVSCRFVYAWFYNKNDVLMSRCLGFYIVDPTSKLTANKETNKK